MRNPPAATSRPHSWVLKTCPRRLIPRTIVRSNTHNDQWLRSIQRINIFQYMLVCFTVHIRDDDPYFDHHSHHPRSFFYVSYYYLFDLCKMRWHPSNSLRVDAWCFLWDVDCSISSSNNTNRTIKCNQLQGISMYDVAHPFHGKKQTQPSNLQSTYSFYWMCENYNITSDIKTNINNSDLYTFVFGQK